MFTEILIPEVMASMVPEGFPVDKLSKPEYKVKVDKDVFIEMRDGVRVAVDVYRPDAPGAFPALYASSPYQKDLYWLPAVPTFHMRETNKIEWFVERGYVAGTRVRDFLEQAQQDVFSAAQGNALETMRPLDEAMAAAVERLEVIQKRAHEGLSHVTGVPTGLPWLDDVTLGLQPGTLVIVAARPSVGKTALALNVCSHAAVKHGKRVVFFSLEMPSDQLALRILASEAKLDTERLGKGRLGAHDWDRIMTQSERLMGSRVWFDDSFMLSPVELRSKCRKLKREGGLDLVVVDYLQLMHAPSERSSHSREQEIATISRSLKALAKELEVPVLALSQLNRAVEKRKGERPMLADLRESGAIEQDADLVIFLHRPELEKDDPGAQMNAETQEVELILAKHRQGPTGLVPLVFFRRHTAFAERKREA